MRKTSAESTEAMRHGEDTVGITTSRELRGFFRREHQLGDWAAGRLGNVGAVAIY